MTSHPHKLVAAQRNAATIAKAILGYLIETLTDKAAWTAVLLIAIAAYGALAFFAPTPTQALPPDALQCAADALEQAHRHCNLPSETIAA